MVTTKSNRCYFLLIPFILLLLHYQPFIRQSDILYSGYCMHILAHASSQKKIKREKERCMREVKMFHVPIYTCSHFYISL